MKVSFLLVSSLAAANAFTAPMQTPHAATLGRRASFRSVDLFMAQDNEETPNEVQPVPAVTAAIWALTSTSAMAAGPDWGIFEGRTGSLLHPLMMFGLLALSTSTAFLGFDWRRQRTIGDEISSLKKSIPDLGDSSSVSAALTLAQGAEEKDSVLIAKLQAALPVEAQVKELQDERKELASKGSRDKHFSQGALLACLGTLFAIEVSFLFIRKISSFLFKQSDSQNIFVPLVFFLFFLNLPSQKGPLNTYARAGKLFPGPHLYAGAGLVCLWAIAAACVPSMQKGSDTARTVHIGANLAGIGLFAWQVVSGVPILLKVVELTKWP